MIKNNPGVYEIDNSLLTLVIIKNEQQRGVDVIPSKRSVVNSIYFFYMSRDFQEGFMEHITYRNINIIEIFGLGSKNILGNEQSRMR